MQLVMIGQTGCGKSTLARDAAAEFDLPYISSGDVARDLARMDPATDISLKAGRMAPEEAMRMQIHHRLEQATLERGGFILDGFPRTVAQLAALLRWIQGFPTFVYVRTDRLTCIERLNRRDRADDNPDAIAAKFADFDERTQPMIDILEEHDAKLDIWNDGEAHAAYRSFKEALTV